MSGDVATRVKRVGFHGIALKFPVSSRRRHVLNAFGDAASLAHCQNFSAAGPRGVQARERELAACHQIIESTPRR
jgi:hypothetical protein